MPGDTLGRILEELWHELNEVFKECCVGVERRLRLSVTGVYTGRVETRLLPSALVVLVEEPLLLRARHLVERLLGVILDAAEDVNPELVLISSFGGAKLLVEASSVEDARRALPEALGSRVGLGEALGALEERLERLFNYCVNVVVVGEFGGDVSEATARLGDIAVKLQQQGSRLLLVLLPVGRGVEAAKAIAENVAGPFVDVVVRPIPLGGV